MSVGWLVSQLTRLFDDPHVAPYLPTWPCSISPGSNRSHSEPVRIQHQWHWFKTSHNAFQCLQQCDLHSWCSRHYRCCLSLVPPFCSFSYPPIMDHSGIILKQFHHIVMCVWNKAGYTATQVACGWAGAIFKATPSFGQEQWGQRPQKPKKSKVWWTDVLTD